MQVCYTCVGVGERSTRVKVDGNDGWTEWK